MGVTRYAYTIVGLRVNLKDLQEKKKVIIHDICKCPLNDISKFKYCPECSSRNEVIYDKHICYKSAITAESINKKWEIYNNDKWQYKNDTLLVCMYKSSVYEYDDRYDFNSFNDIFKLKDEFVKDMIHYGLWDESNFGIYTDIQFY
jgi:hypothetical protein